MSNLTNFNEEWVPIPKFYQYAATRSGLIKNRKFNRILTQYPDKSGYPQVSLSVNGKGGAKRVHLIIANLFVPNPLNLPIVNHKDGNKANPAASNLEWCTHKENSEHAVKNNLYRPQNRVSVIVYKGNAMAGIFPSIKSASIQLGVRLHDLKPLYSMSKTKSEYTYIRA